MNHVKRYMMEKAESAMSKIPDPREKLSLSLAEEVHFMRTILSSLSEEISLLKMNGNLDEKPFACQRDELFAKLDRIRKRREEELQTLHIEKNWDAMTISSRRTNSLVIPENSR